MHSSTHSPRGPRVPRGPHSTHTPRGPRANIDPIRNAAAAIALVSTVIAQPLRYETVGFLLDANGFGDVVVVVDGTEPADSIISVAQCLAEAGAGTPHLTSLVLATVRPCGGLRDDDVDRWLEASDVVDECGLHLIEWYVVDPDGIQCPRDLLGEPERW